MSHLSIRFSVLVLLAATGCSSLPALPGLPGTKDDLAVQEPAPLPPDVPSITVMVRMEGKEATRHVPWREPMFVQDIVTQTGVLDRFHRMQIEIYRPIAGGYHRMDCKFDRVQRRVEDAYDYAVLPGDHLVITQDTSTIVDDMLETLSGPLKR